MCCDDISDVNNCDEEAELPNSPANELPKKTSFYALRKVTDVSSESLLVVGPV